MGDNGTITAVYRESLAAKKYFFENADNIASIQQAANALISSLKGGGKAMVFGNGGSAADSQHLAAELVVRFEKDRKAMPCIALTTNASNITAGGNDYGFDTVFRRQVEALTRPEDVVIAISTSGNSPNVINGAQAALEKGVPVIALTGRDGGQLAKLADIALVVRSPNTARIQEVHSLIIHILCKLIEEAVS